MVEPVKDRLQVQPCVTVNNLTIARHESPISPIFEERFDVSNDIRQLGPNENSAMIDHRISAIAIGNHQVAI